MTDRHEDSTTVWQEVRRRRVFKVIVAYLGAAFGAYEIVMYVVPQLDVADWIFRALLGSIVLGFPVSVVLAWTYDITPTGVVRTPDEFGTEAPVEPTKYGWVIITVVGVVVGLAAMMMRG